MITMQPQVTPFAMLKQPARKSVTPNRFGQKASTASPTPRKAGRWAKLLAAPLMALALLTASGGCTKSKEYKDMNAQYQTASIEERKALLQKGSTSAEDDVRGWVVAQVPNMAGTEEEKLALLEPRTRDTSASVKESALKTIVENLNLPAEKKLPYIQQGLENDKNWAIDGLVNLSGGNEQKIAIIQKGLNENKAWAPTALTRLNIPAESKLVFAHQAIQNGKQWGLDLLDKLSVSPEKRFTELEFAFNRATEGKNVFDRTELFNKAIDLQTPNIKTRIPLLMAGVQDVSPKIKDRAMGLVKTWKDDEANVPYEYRSHLKTIFNQRPRVEENLVNIKPANIKTGDEKITDPAQTKDVPPGMIKVRRTYNRPAGNDYQDAIDALVRMTKS